MRAGLRAITGGRLLACTLVLWAAAVGAVIETYEFSSPTLEERYHQLSQELRCPKCQNQNIADSNAPIAEDLRGLLYQQLESGATDAQILDDMVARYGEFVRYRPAAEGAALWLWLAPALMLLVGLGVVVAILRRASGAEPEAMSEDQQQRIDDLLSSDGEQL